MSELTLYQRQRRKVKYCIVAQLHLLIGDCYGYTEYLTVFEPEANGIHLGHCSVLFKFLTTNYRRTRRLDVDLSRSDCVVLFGKLAVGFHYRTFAVVIQSRLNLLTAFRTPNLNATDHIVSNLNLVDTVPSVNQGRFILVSFDYSDCV